MMHCPKCNEEQQADRVACARCGVVFHKYESYLQRKTVVAAKTSGGRERRFRFKQLVRNLLVPPQTMQRYFIGYVVLWLALTAWGFSYMMLSMAELGTGSQFLHKINLPFHEAGHVLFGFLGQFMGSLGGTLGQLLMPVIAGVALLRSGGDTFGASICLLWFGENFLDIAPYMADARAGELALVGGNHGKFSPYGFHDWEFILGETGLLAYDTVMAATTLNTGRIIMLAAMLWGGCLLWRSQGESRSQSGKWR